MATPIAIPNLRGFRAVRYGPSQKVTPLALAGAATAANPAAAAGDFILTHSSGVYGTLIRFGEKLRFTGQDKIFAHWSHAAIFIDDQGLIIEALGGGVQKRNIDVYRDTEYVVVHLPPNTSRTDREQTVAFAEYCLGESYGWLTIVSVALTLLSTCKIGFGVDGQQICSALVARCLERIGEIFKENEPWHLTPADLAKHFDVRDTGDRGSIPPSDTGRLQYSKPGKRRG